MDEEFQGIAHLRTSTLHKKIASARHDFIKLSGSENKLEALLQVYLCGLFVFHFNSRGYLFELENIGSRNIRIL